MLKYAVIIFDKPRKFPTKPYIYYLIHIIIQLLVDE